MNEREAAMCSMNEYRLRWKGKEKQIQRSWEMMRWQTWQMMRPNYKKGQEPRTPQAFCRFPWEATSEEEALDKYKRSVVTEQEAAVLNRIFDELHKRNNIES